MQRKQMVKPKGFKEKVNPKKEFERKIGIWLLIIISAAWLDVLIGTVINHYIFGYIISVSITGLIFYKLEKAGKLKNIKFNSTQQAYKSPDYMNDIQFKGFLSNVFHRNS